MNQQRQSLTCLGRAYYHPSKCLNCDAPVTLLQHLLDPSAKMSTEYYVEMLTYIFGLKQTDTGTFLLRLLNINEYTFCKQCTQLLTSIRTIRQKFVHQTKKNSYLYHAVVNKPERTEPSTSVATTLTNIVNHCEKTAQNKTPSPPQNKSVLGNQVQPVHVVVDDELEIVGQSKSVTLKTVPPPTLPATNPARNSSALNPSASPSALPKTVDDIIIQVNHCDKGQTGQKYSVMQVILQALGASSTGMLSVKGIQHHIAKNYPWYDAGRKEWHDALLAMLRESEYFAEVSPIPTECGTTFWKINPKYDMYRLVQEAFQNQASDPAPPARIALNSISGDITSVNAPATSVDNATSFPKSDLVITSVTSIVDPPKRASPKPSPVVVIDFGTTTPVSNSTPSEKETKRANDNESNDHSSKVRRLNEDVVTASPIEVVLPDTPSSSGESRSTDTFLSQKPESENLKKSVQQKDETKMRGDGFERVHSPDFEIISSDDDDEVSVCGSDRNDSAELKLTEKNRKTEAQINVDMISEDPGSKYQDLGEDLEMISSDEEILNSDIKIKFEPVSYNSQHPHVNSENTVPPKLVDAASDELPSPVKSCEKDSLLQEKSEPPSEVVPVPDLLEEAMPKIQPTSDEVKPERKRPCMILLNDSTNEVASASVPISIRNHLLEEKVSTAEAQPTTSASALLASMPNLAGSASDQVALTESLQAGLQPPPGRKRIRPGSKEIIPGSKNKIMVKTPKELLELKTIISASISVAREQFRLINEDLNARHAKCFFINAHRIIPINLRHKVKKEGWTSFVDILKVTKNVADTVQRTFLMLDQTMIKIRILAPQKLRLDERVLDYQALVITTQLPVDTLAKYFKIAIQADEFIKSADYKDFRIVLKIIKFKVIRIVKHFTPKEADNSGAHGNVSDSYFYNICNYLKSQEKATSESEGENWSMEKAIHTWDQVKLFKYPINVNIVNLDHNMHGIAGFEKQLSKICIGAKRRRERQQPQLQAKSN